MLTGSDIIKIVFSSLIVFVCMYTIIYFVWEHRSDCCYPCIVCSRQCKIVCRKTNQVRPVSVSEYPPHCPHCSHCPHCHSHNIEELEEP